MHTCDACFNAAMNHGGGLVSETFARVRHWRPQILWPPTPSSKTRKPLPGIPDWFCVTREIQEAKTPVMQHSNTSIRINL